MVAQHCVPTSPNVNIYPIIVGQYPHIVYMNIHKYLHFLNIYIYIYIYNHILSNVYYYQYALGGMQVSLRIN